MDVFPSGSQSVLSRVVAAEVRARLAAERMTQRDFAKALGSSAHNYWSKRLRDELPFTLDDLERIAAYWSEGADELITKAYANHGDWVFSELRERVRQRVDADEAARSGSRKAGTRLDVHTDTDVVVALDPTAGSGAFATKAEAQRAARESMSSFDEADEAARSEDAEKPRLD